MSIVCLGNSADLEKGAVHVVPSTPEMTVHQHYSMHRTIHKLVASHVASQLEPSTAASGPTLPSTVFLNNVTHEDHIAAGYMKVEAARVLEDLRVPFYGVRSKYLNRNAEDLKMLAFYGDLRVPNFVVVDKTKPYQSGVSPDGKRHLLPKGLSFPLKLRPLTGPQGDYSENLPVGVHDGGDGDGLQLHEPIHTEDTLDRRIKEALTLSPKVMVEEDKSALPSVRVFAYTHHVETTGVKKRHVSVVVPPHDSTHQPLSEAHQEALKKMGQEVLSSFVDGVGWCMVYAHLPPAQEGQPPEKEEGKEKEDSLKDLPFFDRVVFNCDLEKALPLLKQTPDGLDNFLRCAVDVALTLQSLSEPRHRVAYNVDDKGYFVRASRFIKKGEVVFGDEGRSMTIVTRPHVMNYWSEEDKVVFSRFAWPLDEGHVYVTWDDDPKMWRPINHSCDPNLIFAQPHSLNTIAGRDIQEGEDLTMDYTTFCDFSMKPFQCFCGSPECRGMIQPNEEALKRYGATAWHRKMPSSTAGQV